MNINFIDNEQHHAIEKNITLNDSLQNWYDKYEIINKVTSNSIFSTIRKKKKKTQDLQEKFGKRNPLHLVSSSFDDQWSPPRPKDFEVISFLFL